jgi:hypothetical protein
MRQYLANILSTGEINSNSDQYRLTDVLIPGEYRWKVRIYNGDKLVDLSGIRGIESKPTYFIIP